MEIQAGDDFWSRCLIDMLFRNQTTRMARPPRDDGDENVAARLAKLIKFSRSEFLNPTGSLMRTSRTGVAIPLRLELPGSSPPMSPSQDPPTRQRKQLQYKGQYMRRSRTSIREGENQGGSFGCSGFSFLRQ